MTRFALRPKVMMALLAMGLLLASAFPAVPTFASVPTLSAIRVALFIDTGNYTLTTPYLTVSSAQGLEVGNRTSAGVSTWLSGGQLSAARFSADQYRVQLLETSDYAQAASLLGKVPDIGADPVIWRVSRQGQPVYQVAAGPFATAQAAQAALASLQAQPQLAPLLKAPIVTGPLHWIAGTFGSEAEAAARQTALAQAGVVADLRYQEDGTGKLVYALSVGNEPDADRLNAVQEQAAKAMPGLVLQTPAAGDAYLILRDDVTQGVGTDAMLKHYMFGASGQKLWITAAVSPASSASAAGSALAIAEKAGRTYPGGLELSVYNGKLAVVDELPFEQYVASVVSAEMGGGWPLEALKAQAVAARTYALYGGMKYKIAHISDTTADQAFFGKLDDNAVLAADATKGEVLVDGSGSLIEPVYSSNSGGRTADPSEIWGNPVPYLASVPSPDDGAEKNRPIWRHIQMQDGTVGYVHQDYLKATGEHNPAGLPIYTATDSGVNVRPLALFDNVKSPPLAQLKAGDRVVAFGEAIESNAYSWMRGAFDASKLAGQLGLAGPVTSLTISKRGPSGRVTELKANGITVPASSPYSYHTLLGGLPSTRFEIEQTNRYTIQGANGTVRTLPESAGTVYAVQGAGATPTAQARNELFVMDGSGQVRAVTKETGFIFKGTGYGHGLGMSQWGARGYAELGYDYQKILKSYYKGVSIVRTE